MGTTGSYSFLIDFALGSLITRPGTAAIMWGWFRWLASSAMRSEVDGGPRTQNLPSITRMGRA
jgi:hypothetical protein